MKRNTHQKNMVKDALLRLQGQHPSADQIYEKVRVFMPTISKATVYRILNQLAEDGTVQRVRMPSSADRYDDCMIDHCHVSCSKCGKVFDLHVPVLLEEIQHHLPASTEYMITDYTLVLKGICTMCQENETLHLPLGSAGASVMV